MFGKIQDGKMVLNHLGKIVDAQWRKTEQIRDNVTLDAYIIMPNHIHGVVFLKGTPSTSPSKTIGAIVRGFRGSATKRINMFRSMPGSPVWQRNYYEHIVRDEDDLVRIQEYIHNNPKKWQEDEYFQGSKNHGSKAVVCENCLFHHECKNLCTMSPKHIDVDEARRRIAHAQTQLKSAIQAREIGEEEKQYLIGVLDRGESSCKKAEQTLASKTSSC